MWGSYPLLFKENPRVLSSFTPDCGAPGQRVGFTVRLMQLLLPTWMGTFSWSPEEWESVSRGSPPPRGSRSVCGCRLSVFMGGGEFKIPLRHRLELEPRKKAHEEVL